MTLPRCIYCGDLLRPVGEIEDLLTIYEAEDGTTDCTHLHPYGEPLAHQPEGGWVSPGGSQ